MIKILLTAYVTLLTGYTFGQNTQPRLELYTAPGLFFEGLNSNTLVPKRQQNNSRLGDDVSYDFLTSFTTRNSRWVIKGGLGYRQRHYSLAKYNVGDFFIDLFLFDASPRPRDTFALSRVRFTNNYIDVPLSVAYGIGRRRKGLPWFTAGINVRLGFLTESSAVIEADSSILPLPTPQETNVFKKIYTQGATKLTLSVEPYLEGSFFVYKGIGLIGQLRPFSFYSSRLNKTFTTGTLEVFGCSAGLIYDFNR
jgi:hypothetical protein